MSAQRASTELNRFTRSLFHALPSRYDTLAYLLSFGQDRRWRAQVVSRVAAARPKRVLDVACGPAGVTLAIARATDAGVIGVDLTEEMLRRGLANVAGSPYRARIRLAVARAEQLPFTDAAFDAISFSYLMRYVDDPAATIRELARCLRPGGAIACLEFGVPAWPPAHLAWLAYTRLGLPALGFLLGGRPWYQVGRFLGPSITNHYARHPIAAHVAAWQAAGLRSVVVQPMSFGGGVVISATKSDVG
ncbi:MAG TPA: class I SAM-dependent methyltransferase [Acidothermaceae bacterium]|jgi:demethylmenaquinone methyltransferase/2-methoxy-6-polyprenyl-1,4-benzoquinol methylase